MNTDMTVTNSQAGQSLILVIEDDRFTRLQLRDLLTTEGYQVAEASDGKQGLAVYQKLQPHIVLLDALMPVMDGFDCCMQLRKLCPEDYAVPILIITSLEDQASVDRAFMVGATDYVTKPIHWPVLRQRVRRLLEQAHLHQQVRQQMQELRASETRFRNIITHHGDSILIVDLQGMVQFANPLAAVLFNCPVSALCGRDFFGELVTENQTVDLNTDVIQLVGGTADTEEMRVVQTQVNVQRQDGQTLVAELRMVETQWQGQVAYIASLRDITERKRTEAALRQSEAQLRQQAAELEVTLRELQQTQAQLVQSEKMSSLGQMVAGIAHEINNPVNFISGNLTYINQYTQEILKLLGLYQHYYPEPVPELQSAIATVDLDFLIDDQAKILASMKSGAERIRQIVVSLRNFSRLDEAEMKSVDVHEGLDNTLLVLQHQLQAQEGKPAIQIIKHYGTLPKIECYASQLNQVFMNILLNAVEALREEQEEPSRRAKAPTIAIVTEIPDLEELPDPTQSRSAKSKRTDTGLIVIRISDNGPGMSEAVKNRVFNPFFTTKPVGKGTGLGLSIAYQIIEKHGGTLLCQSQAGQGTEFIIQIPVCQN